MKHGTFIMIQTENSKTWDGSNWHPKVRMSKSQMNVMLIPFFDINGIVHFKLGPQGQTFNQAYSVCRNFQVVTWSSA
jgi:hypothetical protein